MTEEFGELRMLASILDLNKCRDNFGLAVGDFPHTGFNDWPKGCVAVLFEELAAKAMGGII